MMQVSGYSNRCMKMATTEKIHHVYEIWPCWWKQQVTTQNLPYAVNLFSNIADNGQGIR